MTLLALDLGTKTGACFGMPGDAVSRIECETWALPSGGADDVGPIMAALRDQLEDRLMRGIEVLVFEAPYTARHQVNGRWVEAPNQTRRAYGMAAICEEAAHRRRIRCIEVVTSTLKKEFASHGRADKAMMIASAKRRGFVVKNDHEADAAACWMHGVLHLWPEHAHRYDPLFTTGR